MHRFFIFEPDKISESRVIISSDELLHQMCDVLRFKTGERIIFLDNSGYEYLCEINKISKKEISALIIEKKKNAAEPSIKICLYQAIPKTKALHVVVEHLVIAFLVILITHQVGDWIGAMFNFK